MVLTSGNNDGGAAGTVQCKLLVLWSLMAHLGSAVLARRAADHQQPIDGRHTFLRFTVVADVRLATIAVRDRADGPHRAEAVFGVLSRPVLRDREADDRAAAMARDRRIPQQRVRHIRRLTHQIAVHRHLAYAGTPM